MDRGNRWIGIGAFGLAAAWLLLAGPPAGAVAKCKVKVDKKTGALLVNASDVTGNPVWGSDPNLVTAPFANPVDCFGGGKLKSCRLGAPGSAAETTPPPGCAVFVADDGPDACSARVPNCTVGVRSAFVGSSGQALLSLNNIGSGSAAEFSGASDFATLVVQNGDDGEVIRISASGAGSSPGIVAHTSRSEGSLASMEITNPDNPRAAVFARTNGLGYAAQLEVNDDASPATALFARTTSSDPSSRAAVFVGDVQIQGNLTKSSGSFLIDHPLDPANKYLSHSFVESPDMMNVYNGNAVLGADGRAVVELPEWFESLNRDFRYQLTPIGGPGPEVHVAEKIAGNRFTIAGGKPGLEVSWQVTGVRQDAYANAHRVPVEERKPEALAGTYLHPELFGAGPERQLDLVKR